jgi:malonate decarboxylase beta subunit
MSGGGSLDKSGGGCLENSGGGFQKRKESYLEASARERILGVLDAGTFLEFLPPIEHVTSPHLAALDTPGAFDDGIIVGSGTLGGRKVLAAAQEGGFMGGAVGEVHGAKLTGLLQRALDEKPDAVVMLVESGGVRLHEANAGLIAISEIMRALLAARRAGVKVLIANGGQFGCFGGMGIVARLADYIVMSEEARLGLSGPEVIETTCGVQEFDSRDRALVWRTVGGKHRYLLREADALVADSISAFREALLTRIGEPGLSLDLATLEAEHALLSARVTRFTDKPDGLDIWAALGIEQPQRLPELTPAAFLAATSNRRA